MLKFKLIGERIAVTKVEETLTGTILLPQNANRDFELGKVVAVGDGILNAEKKRIYVEPGQFVLFQIPTSIKSSATYRIQDPKLSDNTFSLIHQGDVLGTLSGTCITLETFTVAGNWVLLEFFRENNGQIFIPDTATHIEEYRFKVLQKGVAVDDDRYAVGDEVFVERQRANPIVLGSGSQKKELVFIDKQYVYGVNA